MKKNYGIIFDCDGTLTDSLSQALDSLSFALAQVGATPPSHEEIKRYFGAGADRILNRILGDEEKGLVAFQHYLDHQSELAARTRLHPGVRQLLEHLAAQEVPVAVVTGRHARDLEVVLGPHKLDTYFVTLVADNHVPRSKPDPAGVLMAAKCMGLPPENTLYVGDAIYDVQAAHAAGSVAVAALWDALAKPDELYAERPAFSAHTPMEVWSFFTERFSDWKPAANENSEEQGHTRNPSL